MIKVFFAPLDVRNVTGYLFKEALCFMETLPPAVMPRFNPDYSKILYLAPSSPKVREARRLFHRTVAEDPSLYCYIPPEMATPEEFAKRIYSLYGEKMIVRDSLVPVFLSALSGKGLGYASLLSDFIAEIKGHYPGKDVHEIRAIFTDTFRDLNIPESVAKVPMECFEVMEKYLTFLEDKGLVDSCDVIRACTEFIPAMKQQILVVDGFYDPDVSQRYLLKALVEHSEAAFISVPYGNGIEGVSRAYRDFLNEAFSIRNGDIYYIGDEGVLPRLHYCSYTDPEGEAEGIARNIKSLYVSGKARELEKVIVTFPSVERHTPMLERVFRRYGIPFYLEKKKSLAGKRPFLDLIALLSSVAEGYPRVLFAQFLSSKYFGKVPLSLRKWMPLLSLESGVISGKESWLDLGWEGSGTVDKEWTLKDGVGKDLEWIFRNLRELEEKRTDSFSFYAGAVKKIIEVFGFLDTPQAGSSDEREQAGAFNEEKKAFDEVMELLSFTGELFPGNISLSEFVDLFVHILHRTFLEKEGAGVKVLDFFDVMGLSPEYLFFGGLTDGAMPRRQDMDYFLPDSVRRKLGLLHLDKYLDVQRFLFMSIVSSSSYPHLSFPKAEGESLNLPSSFLYSGEEVKERVPGILSREEYLVRQGSIPLSARISEISIPTYEMRLPAQMKVTDIDAYRFCPRKFFVERMAGLVPLEIKEYEVEAMTLGSILHAVMERIIPGHPESLAVLEEKARKVAEEVLRERKIPGYWKELVRDTFIEMLPDIYELELEIRRGGYTSVEVERTISGEPVRGIKLRGKIDRIDVKGNAIQIIDYKTGGTGLTCSQVAYGNENLQLFLYAAIMKSHGYSVERVGIYSLKDIQVKWCPSQKRGRGKPAETMDDYVTASLKFLEEAVRGLRKGDFRAVPLSEYNCRNCHEYPLCPYVQQ